MMSSASNATKQQRPILGLLLAGIGAVCLPAYLVFQNNNGGLGSDERFGQRALQEEFENDAQMYRLLSELGDAQSREEDLSIPDYLLHAGEEGHLSAEEAIETAIQQASLQAHPQPDVPAYDILDVLWARKVFGNTYGVLVYDNISDEFLFLYSKDQKWQSGCVKLKMSFMKWTYMLRKTFPDRFCGPDCDEWVVGFSSGDYPHFYGDGGYCLTNFPHASEECPQREAPVFQFGSVFKDYEPLPNMIAMPMPLVHMLCFEIWVAGKSVCYKFKGGERGSLVYRDDLEWEDLTPQVVWRGTDFGFLNHLFKVESIETGRAPMIDIDMPPDVRQMEHDSIERRTAATQSMRENYHTLSPRWKSVVLTAEAEREHEMKVQAAEKSSKENQEKSVSMPWADMRFTGPSAAAGRWGQKPQAYNEFADLGIQAIGGSKNSQELSTYRYHIDLGGGGGTTWTGTHSKLAMPGLLFHHVTPTKDYIHDRMMPWVHYVPVKADLSDLKEKYEWAESHPEVAKRIAQGGTELMRHIGSHDGFEEMFQEDFVEPMRRVMEAYRPVSQTHPTAVDGNNDKLSWRQIFKQAQVEHGFAEHRVRQHCTGKGQARKDSCREGGIDETV